VPGKHPPEHGFDRPPPGVFASGCSRRRTSSTKETVMMKIKPLNDRLLVRRTGEEQKTSGGIIIPDTAKEKPQRGRVVAAGPGKRGADGQRAAMEVAAGDEVFFSKYAGTEIKIEGVEHVFMKEEDILGVLE
jgi:chaperonin GroES